MLHKQLAIVLLLILTFYSGIAQNFKIIQPKIISNESLWLKKNASKQQKFVEDKQVMDIFYAKPDSIDTDSTFGVYWRIHSEFLPEENVYVREDEVIVDSINLKYKNAIVNFLWLNDSFNEDSLTYTYNSIAPVQLDTIYFHYVHVNRSGMPNYIRTRVVNVGNNGFPVLTGAPLWENIVTTDTSLTAANNDPSYLYNDIMVLPVTEEILFDRPFAVVVDFYGGDKAEDEFYLFCTYNNPCFINNDETLAQHSKFYPNSFFNISAKFDNQIIEGLFPSLDNILGTDVNGNEIAGESKFCEAFYVQNWHIGTTVSFEASLSGNIVANADTLCRGDLLTLKAVPSFGTPPYSYLWLSKNGAPISTQKEVELLAQLDETYTLRITDALDNAVLIEKDIIANRLRLVMPEAMSLACGETTNVEPVVNSTSGNVTYNWVNGNTEPTINVFPGNYTLTITDGYCIATGSVNIKIEADITADFQALVDNELSVSFNNLSTNASSYFWDFGDGNTSTEENPFHIYANKNQYIVSLNAVSNNCSITKYQTVNLSDFPVNIINEAFVNNKVSISPNPSTTGQFWVTLQSNQKNGAYNYAVFDGSGKILLNKKEQIATEQNQFSLNLADFANGIYFLKIFEEQNTIIKKLLLVQ